MEPVRLRRRFAGREVELIRPAVKVEDPEGFKCRAEFEALEALFWLWRFEG